MKKLGLSLLFVLLTITQISAKNFKLTEIEVYNSGSEEMMKGDLMLQVDKQNRIEKAFVAGLPIKVSLNKLATTTPKILRVSAFGLHIVDLYSKYFTVKEGGRINLSFKAVEGVKDNYNLDMKYNSGHGKWMVYNNGRIVTKLVARLDIKPGTSVIKILKNQPKVEHSYLVY